jgi:hypothetical protein
MTSQAISCHSPHVTMSEDLVTWAVTTDGHGTRHC